MTEYIMIDGYEFEAVKIPTEKASILMIRCPKGFLGCGYFNIEVADKLEECVALVTGVNSFKSMLSAQVFKLSANALDAGVSKGMSGKDALLKIAGR
jgi:uncharacterized protein YunC (DUF1805 family)